MCAYTWTKRRPSKRPGAVPAQRPPARDRLAGSVRREPLSRVVLALGVLQLVLFLAYFAQSIHPIPRWDFYDWATGYLEAPSLAGWLWAQHNEHRPVMSKLAAAMDVAVFGGRLYPVALLALASLLGWSVVLLRTALRCVQVAADQKRWIVGCLLVLLFPTFTLDNYTYPTNMQFAFVAFFFVLAISAFLRASALQGDGGSVSMGWVAASLAAAVACSLSSANGLFVWGVLGWMAWRLRLRSSVAVAALVIVGAVTVAGYTVGYERPSSAGFYVGSASDLVSFVEYFVAYFGMPWVAAPSVRVLGLVVGAAMVVCGSVAVVWKGWLAREVEAIEVLGVAILLFCGATGLVTTFGRLHLTELPAHRYTIFAVLAQVALFLLLLPAVRRAWPRIVGQRRAMIVALVIGLLVVAQQVVVGQFAASRAAHFASVRDLILAGNRARRVTRQIYPDPLRLEHHLAVFRKRGLYLYRD